MGEAAIVLRPPSGANAAVENLLADRQRAIGDSFNGRAIAIYGPMDIGLDSKVRTVIEDQQAANPAEHLVVLLDTDGGFIDVVNRMVDTIRRHHKVVTFVIPNAAYSAGTVLAMSGDAIYMDYYSRLGPIDPQVEGENGQMIPALGYLKQYEGLLERARSPDGLSVAEIQLFVNGFDQAELYMYDQARELSVTLLTDWLCKYKFKDWNETQDRKLPVTPDMRQERAEDVAKQLNDTDRWHSHSNGISAEVLRDELKLRIDDFGPHKQAIQDYHVLLTDYMEKNRVYGVVHAAETFTPYHVH